MTRAWPPAVKVCGLTRAQDAQAAVAAGAAYLGVILAPGSPRTLTPGEAARVLGEAGATRVGVFVNATAAELRQAAREARLQVLQLHGDEPPELAGKLRAEGYRVWKALRPRGGAGLGELAAPFAGRVDALLLDGWSAHARGGTGTAFPWEEVAARLGELPEAELVVAGGLDPANVARAARLLRPAVLDVSSGVESAPGVKDPAALAAFCAEVRSLAGD
jgi:phosphoribosylanthranilate isomerase